MTIDPRLADRRKVVAEDRARGNIKRLLRLLAFVSVLAVIVWLLLSPTFSIGQLDVSGVQSSATIEILDDEQIVDGRPLVLIRAGRVEAALLEDPWVKEADVDVDWPDRVVVAIIERTPTAWVKTSGGWARRAVDGVVLPGPDQPDDTMGSIVLPKVDDEAALESVEMLAALEFMETLPVGLSSAARVNIREGELWAVVGGYDVRLGRPVEMAAKALSVASLLQEELKPGSVINVIAPTNPAVTPPGDKGN